MLSACRVHTTLPTAGVDRLRIWYEDVLGFDDVDAEVADLKARGVVFEEYDAPRTDGGTISLPPTVMSRCGSPGRTCATTALNVGTSSAIPP